MTDHHERLSRRGFIRVAAASTAGLALLLEACAPPAPTAAPKAAPAATPAPGASGGSVKLPTFVAFEGPRPDLAGSADGLIAPAYFNYPRNAVKSVPKPVGSGEDVTAMMYTTQAAPTPLEQNPVWQKVHQDLGVTMKFPIIQLADYPTKLNTTLASGTLPDLLSLGAGLGSGMASLPEFLQSQCSDLTPYVSGDAVKEYPNLANLPTFAWRNRSSTTRSLPYPWCAPASARRSCSARAKCSRQPMPCSSRTPTNSCRR